MAQEQGGRAAPRSPLASVSNSLLVCDLGWSSRMTCVVRLRGFLEVPDGYRKCPNWQVEDPGPTNRRAASCTVVCHRVVCQC